jgi:hypothetical protein
VWTFECLESAVITGVSSGGIGYVTTWQDPTGWNATVGFWDPEDPDNEPLGDSQLYVDVGVGTGGLLVFSYSVKTKDIDDYDYMDIYLEVPGDTVTIVSHLGSPGPVNLVFYETPMISRSINLAPWSNQDVRLVVSVHQDGFVDQTQGTIKGITISACPVAPITTITDSTAMQLELDDVDMTRLTATMQTKWTCFTNAVQMAGGMVMVNSAWRSQEYQSHLYETRERWKKLKENRSADCASLRNDVASHMNYHQLDTTLIRPVAKSAGHHPLGVAIDANVTGISNFDVLAANCSLVRPYLDCSEQGKKYGRCDRPHFELIKSLWGQP